LALADTATASASPPPGRSTMRISSAGPAGTSSGISTTTRWSSGITTRKRCSTIISTSHLGT